MWNSKLLLFFPLKVLLHTVYIFNIFTWTEVIDSSSVPDPEPDPDPLDPHVFGPPGSGSRSTSQRYGSGSGSGYFYHHAKIVRKTLIPYIL
jgi:hypothetical protein